MDLIATVIDFCTPPTEQGRGHPRSATVRVLATLRQFLREGTPWRSLKATADKVSGSTLRRHLEQWAGTGLLAQVHAVLVGMVRGDPTLILDTCSVRAKRGQPRGSGLGKRRWPVERSNALENKRLALRYDRLGFIIQSLLQAACIFLVAGRVANEL